MKVLKNNDFFKIGGDRTVTVSVTFDISPKADEGEVLINAAEAIKFYRNYKIHKTWTRKIEVR
jgi:hypothetical protein